MTQNDLQVKKNRAVLVGLWAHRLSVEENATEETVDELADLLETAGGECVGTVLQSKDSPDPRTFIGEGKVAEVRELVRAMDADMVIFDNSLSPSQQRVLSEELKVAVMDRSALILDIFAQRAKTKEGRLQVELAQYKYLLPRLLGMWTHLERQEGAIGTPGPGEPQLETDRRHIHRKIAKLEDELRDVRRVRATQRERRIKNEVLVVAIVGYTNAGKSPLRNKLTGAEIPANNRLFDTLDTTTRTLEISDTCTVLLSDTVGFIRKLPHQLVEAFKATLEELERLRALALNYLGLELTVGVGLSCATLGELRQSTEGARSALDYRVLMGGGRVLYIGDIEPGTSAELSLDEDDQRELANAVKLGTAEQVEELVCSLIERLRKHRMDLAQCSLFLLELTTALIRLARAGDVELEAVFGPGFTGGMPISQFRSLDELEHWCVDRCLNLRELLGRQRSYSAWRTVERAKHYIGQHYADSELSVESVCTHLHLSPAYFSTLFKREEGMSFIAYVTNVRMERAAQLLLESDDKTYLIAEKTGYTDPNYFSYVFKRHFGVTPTKYRSEGK